jgi:hypothetical protein
MKPFKKNDYIEMCDGRYKVICCDDEIAIIAPTVYDSDEGCYVTDYEKLEAVPNDRSVIKTPIRILGNFDRESEK